MSSQRCCSEGGTVDQSPDDILPPPSLMYAGGMLTLKVADWALPISSRPSRVAISSSPSFLEEMSGQISFAMPEANFLEYLAVSLEMNLP